MNRAAGVRPRWGGGATSGPYPTVRPWSGLSRPATPARSGVVRAAIFLAVACLLFVIDHNWDASIEAFARLDRQLAGSLEAVQGGSPERRVAYFLFALLGVGLALGRGARPLRVHGAAAYAMLAFLGWAFLSLLWSLSPQLTVRRGGVVVMLSVGIAGLLRRFSLREILGLLLFLSLAYLLVGVMAELSLGTFEPLGRHYRFAGTLHPNIQGVNCALAFLAGLWLATAPEEPWNRRWIGVLAVAVAGLFLLLTRSRGAVGSALAAAGVLGLLRLRRRHAALAVAAGIGLAGVAGFLLAAELAEEPWGLILLGRDPTKAGTLTGRIPLWDSLLRYAGEHPVLGYGYGAFIDPERGSAVATEVGAFVLGGPHSAYISVLGDLGAIGLLLFVAALVFSLVRALRHHSSGEWNPHAFLAAVIVFYMLHGLLAGHMVYPNLSLYPALILGAVAFVRPREERPAVGRGGVRRLHPAVRPRPLGPRASERVSTGP